MKVLSLQHKYINRALSVLIAIGFIAGLFQHFVLTLPHPPDMPPHQIDGSVVATGGQGRIDTGLTLLSDTRAATMLITGVGTDANKHSLALALSLSDDALALFTCCVDIDSTAQDTAGNAHAAAKWAAENNLTHLLLVTANYHMPRAKLAFLRHQLFSSDTSGVQLSYWPVIPEDLMQTRWYTSWAQIKLLGREFAKYTLAQLHII